MRVKTVTIVLFFAAFLLLLRLLYLLYDRPPQDAGQDELSRYAIELLITFAFTAFTFLGAAFASVIWVRRAKEEFLKENRENLRELIEGSLKDHEKSDKE